MCLCISGTQRRADPKEQGPELTEGGVTFPRKGLTCPQTVGPAAGEEAVLRKCSPAALRSTCAPILRRTDLGTTHDGPLEGGKAGGLPVGGARVGPGPRDTGRVLRAAFTSTHPCTCSRTQPGLCPAEGPWGEGPTPGEECPLPALVGVREQLCHSDRTRGRCRGPETSPCPRREHGAEDPDQRVGRVAYVPEPSRRAAGAGGTCRGHMGTHGGSSVLQPDRRKPAALLLLPRRPDTGRFFLLNFPPSQAPQPFTRVFRRLQRPWAPGAGFRMELLGGLAPRSRRPRGEFGTSSASQAGGCRPASVEDGAPQASATAPGACLGLGGSLKVGPR